MFCARSLLVHKWLLAPLLISPGYAALAMGSAELNETDDRYTASLLGEMKPNPRLTAADVVQIQMRALQQNGPDDAGIHTTYRFASPENRQVTGPYERFAQMIKAAPYDAMLNSVSLSFGEIRIDQAQAMQEVRVVTFDGKEVVYVFLVRRQVQPPYKDCWMTDAVYTLPPVQEEEYKLGPPGFG